MTHLTASVHLRLDWRARSEHFFKHTPEVPDKRNFSVAESGTGKPNGIVGIAEPRETMGMAEGEARQDSVN